MFALVWQSKLADLQKFAAEHEYEDKRPCRMLQLITILAHPLGFTRRPVTLRNHIPEKLRIFLTEGAYALTPLVWLRHCGIALLRSVDDV